MSKKKKKNLVRILSFNLLKKNTLSILECKIRVGKRKKKIIIKKNKEEKK